jgi:hypothetical protein
VSGPCLPRERRVTNTLPGAMAFPTLTLRLAGSRCVEPRGLASFLVRSISGRFEDRIEKC